MMKHIFEEKGPIGAVVREADQLFSNITRKTSFNGAFNRIEWQYFNLLKERKRVPVAEVMDYLSFFDAGARIQTTIDRFQREGLAEADADGIYLSPKGEEVFDEVLQVQEKIKEKSVQDISPEAYRITIDTLQKIMDNLQGFLARETDIQPAESTDIYYKKGQEMEKEEQKIRQLVTRMEKAHNSKDPGLLASLFAEHATFVNAAGKRLHSRAAIFQSAQKVMDTVLAKSLARYEVSKLKFIRKDVAIAEIEQRPIKPSGELNKEESSGCPTYVLVKEPESDNWQIVAGQNTLTMKFQGAG